MNAPLPDHPDDAAAVQVMAARSRAGTDIVLADGTVHEGIVDFAWAGDHAATRTRSSMKDWSGRWHTVDTGRIVTIRDTVSGLVVWHR